MTEAQKFMDLVYERIKHGDVNHQIWLKETCESLAKELDGYLILNPEQNKTMVAGMMKYIKYADAHISFQKVRSGNFGMTEEEKKIAPAIQEAMNLLQLPKE